MAAAEVDARLIDPTPAAFAAALRKAHAAANRGVVGRAVRLDRDDGFWGRFARDCLREPEGRRRSCRAGAQTPEVLAGWWTDPAGRRHVRVLGRTRNRYPRLRPEGELRVLPPWWHVYPEAVLAVRRGSGEEYLACCRCGAVGSPASLGWMGDTCGPCFDRAADGGAVAGGFGHFGGWGARHAGVVGFSPDGGRLIGTDLALRWRAVSRADRAAVGWRNLAGTVAAVGGGPGATVVARGDGTVYRWAGAGPPERVAAWPRVYGRVLLSADGARAVVLSAGAGFTADLTAARPRYARADGLRAYAAARFTPDGGRVVGLTPAGELLALDPATLAETAVRGNVFDGLSPYGFAHDLAVSPDGAAVAAVRETYSPPAHAVCLVPLAGGRPAADLPLPRWHRPTAAAFAPDGGHLVTTDAQTGWAGFWALPGRKPVGFVRAVPEDPGWRGGRVEFSPCGGAVAVLYAGFHQDRGSTVVVWPWPEVVRAAGSEERG
ncbi:MAG: hypothetical protein C0501_09140 [Isosphaera sp.]|nr:hypothetical protein [Isosphaera sp.]